jgi:hypothetical protein
MRTSLWPITLAFAIAALGSPVLAQQPTLVRSPSGIKEPKHGNWYPTPPQPGSSRTFSAFEVSLESGRRANRYYPIPVSPTAPPDNAFYDDVYAVVRLYDNFSNGGGAIAGDLVFFDGEDMPVADLVLKERVVLFFPRRDFEPVLQLLKTMKRGVIAVFQPCEGTGDQRACYAVGQLRFPGSPMATLFARTKQPTR